MIEIVMIEDIIPVNRQFDKNLSHGYNGTNSGLNSPIRSGAMARERIGLKPESSPLPLLLLLLPLLLLLLLLANDLFRESPPNLGDKTVLIFVAMVQVLTVGLLADLIASNIALPPDERVELLEKRGGRSGTWTRT